MNRIRPTRRALRLAAAALALCLDATLVRAQTSPPAAAPAKPAPTSLGHSAPRAAPAAKPPVIQAPRNAHPAKPASAKPAAHPPPTVVPEAPPPPEKPPETPNKGSNTGLPLPRWAALRADDVNLRTGPGTRYPIDWQYHRRDLPMQIEREFEVWRLVEDPDGVKGWVHQATLTGRRSFVVSGAERTMHSAAAEDAAPVARLKPGVVGRIRSCEAQASWCEVQVGDYRGWLKRSEFYGTYPSEAVNG